MVRRAGCKAYAHWLVGPCRCNREGQWASGIRSGGGGSLAHWTAEKNLHAGACIGVLAATFGTRSIPPSSSVTVQEACHSTWRRVAVGHWDASCPGVDGGRLYCLLCCGQRRPAGVSPASSDTDVAPTPARVVPSPPRQWSSRRRGNTVTGLPAFFQLRLATVALPMGREGGSISGSVDGWGRGGGEGGEVVSDGHGSKASVSVDFARFGVAPSACCGPASGASRPWRARGEPGRRKVLPTARVVCCSNERCLAISRTVRH